MIRISFRRTEPVSLGQERGGCLAGAAAHPRKTVTRGLKPIFEAAPPAVSEHFVPQTRIPDSAQPLVQPYAQPLRVLGVSEVRLTANVVSGGFKRWVEWELAILRKDACKRSQRGWR